MNDWNKLYTRAENLLSRLEGLLPGEKPEPDWNSAVAFRWRKYGRTEGFSTGRLPLEHRARGRWRVVA
jgi:predicted AAA+ superfamily ATPase